jgi:HK97 family phage major capsid protein
MSRVKALKAKQAKLLQDHKAAVAKVDAAQSAEERKPLREQAAAIKAEFDEISADLKEAEMMEAAEAGMTAAAPVEPVTAPLKDASKPSIIPGAVGADLDKMAGFKTASEYYIAVRNASIPGATVDERLAKMFAAPSSVMSSTGTSGEGYLVPPQIRQEVFDLAFPGSDLVSRLDPEPSDSNAVDIDADETTPWGATGVQAKWRAEASQMTASKMVTKHESVRLQELYAFVNASDELLADAPRLQNRMTVKSAAAINYKASDAVVNGTGAGMPLGWMASGALVTVSKKSGQAAGTIVAENVLAMYARLLTGGAGRAFWAANTDTLPQIAVMTIGNQPIWTPPNSGLKEAPQGMLLGLPIVWAEQAQTVGTKGDLQLINPAGYYAAVKRGEGVRFDSSIHLYFDYGLTAFRWTFRLGGQPFLSAAVSPAKGTNTKSHFVVVETRS